MSISIYINVCVFVYSYTYTYQLLELKDLKKWSYLLHKNLKLAIMACGNFKPIYILIFILISWFVWN